MKTLDYVIKNNGLLLEPLIGLEDHPYLVYEQEQKQNASKYIIGTFPPISYLLDNKEVKKNKINCLKEDNNIVCQNAPKAPFYHGNQLDMWELLMYCTDSCELQKKEEGKVDFLLTWLKNNDLFYSDIISSCTRKKYDASDQNLIVREFNYKLIESILKNKAAKAILFNTSGIFNSTGLQVYNSTSKDKPNLLENWEQGDVKPDKNKSFNLFLRALQQDFTLFIKDYNSTEYIEINSNNLKTLSDYKFKVVSKLKIKPKNAAPKYVSANAHVERKFIVCTGPSPSGASRTLKRYNKVYQKYQNNSTPEAFTKCLYGMFVNEEWKKLAKLNV